MLHEISFVSSSLAVDEWLNNMAEFTKVSSDSENVGIYCSENFIKMLDLLQHFDLSVCEMHEWFALSVQQSLGAKMVIVSAFVQSQKDE